MEPCDTMMLQGSRVMERVAEDLFDIMPEEEVVLVFIDRQGNRWSNRPDAPFGVKGDESLINSLMARIDDGDDPAVVHTGDVCVVASQLTRDHTQWGHVMVVFPKRGVETANLNLDLADLVLRQANLLAQYADSKP